MILNWNTSSNATSYNLSSSTTNGGASSPAGAFASAWTGNVLFSTRIFRNNDLRFDTAFIRTGGSDHHFFASAKQRGATIVFAREAIVYSAVSGSRARWPFPRGRRRKTT